MAKKKIAVGYVRTARAETGDLALIKQENEIIEYCKKNGFELHEIFKDNGCSGLNMDREAWPKLKEYVADRSNGVNTLILANVDRISRSYHLSIKEITDLEEYSKIEIRLLNHNGKTHRQVQKTMTSLEQYLTKPCKKPTSKKNKGKKT